jgi:hypothetical protein
MQTLQSNATAACLFRPANAVAKKIAATRRTAEATPRKSLNRECSDLCAKRNTIVQQEYAKHSTIIRTNTRKKRRARDRRRMLQLRCCGAEAFAALRPIAFHFALVRTPPFNKNIDTT